LLRRVSGHRENGIVSQAGVDGGSSLEFWRMCLPDAVSVQ